MEPGRTAERLPVTTPRLLMLLVLTMLPVPVTSLLRPALAGAGPLAGSGLLEPPFGSFVVYAASNWTALAAVVYAAGWAQLRRHGLRLVGDPWRVAAAMGAFPVGVGIYVAVERALAALGMTGVMGMVYPAPSGAQVLLLAITAVSTAAFCEEVFFRVVWIGVLGARVPPIAAAAVALLVFALIHYPYFGLGGVLFVAVWAILPSVLFLAFGDLTAPLLLHLLNNAFAYLVVPLWLR